MIISTFLLLLILLALVVQISPVPGGAWSKLLAWAALSLVFYILIITHAIHL